ncbi:hypothetical protein EG834_21015 [bacterium]|nr:hypothetical protein [bacterium]
MKEIIASLVFGAAFFGLPADAQSIAAIECTPSANTFVVRSIPDSDEGQTEQEIPEFPAQCKLGGATYRAKIKRASYGLHHCGAQPVLSIWVSRANKPFIADAAFGFNCQAGPAISLIEVTAKSGQAPKLRLCVLREGLYPTGPTVCKSVPLVAKAHLIDQGSLDEIVAPTSPCAKRVIRRE